MAEFRKLSLSQQKGQPVYVNVDKINYMRKMPGGFTQVWFGDGKSLGSNLDVVETPEEIMGVSAKKAAA